MYKLAALRLRESQAREVQTNLVPRAHDPFGLRQGSRALANRQVSKTADWFKDITSKASRNCY